MHIHIFVYMCMCAWRSVYTFFLLMLLGSSWWVSMGWDAGEAELWGWWRALLMNPDRSWLGSSYKHERWVKAPSVWFILRGVPWVTTSECTRRCRHQSWASQKSFPGGGEKWALRWHNSWPVVGWDDALPESMWFSPLNEEEARVTSSSGD